MQGSACRIRHGSTVREPPLEESPLPFLSRSPVLHGPWVQAADYPPSRPPALTDIEHLRPAVRGSPPPRMTDPLSNLHTENLQGGRREKSNRINGLERAIEELPLFRTAIGKLAEGRVARILYPKAMFDNPRNAMRRVRRSVPNLNHVSVGTDLEVR